MKPKRKLVALAREVDLHQRVVTALLILGDALEHEGMDRLDHLELAPRAITGVLALLAARLHLVERVVRGDIDPGIVWTMENEADVGGADGTGVVLRPWSMRELHRRLAAEVARLEKELDGGTQKAK